MMKKIVALMLALVMVLVMGTTAFADSINNDKTSAAPTLGDGTNAELGVAGTWTAKDTPIPQAKTINILKEITAYNPDESYVYGPSITYTYAIESASGSELVSITDDMNDHASGVATVSPAVLGEDDIKSGAPSMTGTSTNTIAWTNADILDASSTGTANYKKLAIDFSNVVFSKPGVYRYKITETAPSKNTMTAAGVIDGDIKNVRYLDVYVMRSSTFNPTHDGTSDHQYTADDWSIYGYVCISQESVTTNAGGTTDVTTSTKKTNGFVSETHDDGSGGTTDYTADQYYTYNLTITKDLVGDDTMIDHQFPFEVAFDTTTNSKGGTFQLIVESDDKNKSTVGGDGLTAVADIAKGAPTVNDPTPTETTGTSSAIKKIGSAQVLSKSNYKVKIADGNTTTGTTKGLVKIIGIPYGVLASVTETNDVIGTTYTATAKEDVTTKEGTSLVGNKKLTTSGELSSDEFSASIDNTETATRAVDIATANSTNVNAAVQFTNTLSIISPTGVVVRVAPYALILIAGIALLLICRRRKTAKED